LFTVYYLLFTVYCFSWRRIPVLKKLRVVPLIILLLAPVAAAFQDAPWQTFNSREGKFSVLLPTEPKVEVQDVDSAVGKLTLYSYSASNKVGYFMASYGDYPVEPSDAANAEQILNGVRDGVLNSISGEKLSDTNIVLKGRTVSGPTTSGATTIDRPGREFTAKKIIDG